MSMTLGQKVKSFREQSRLTLREIESATGISNAYLSQLENDKIKRPSATVLYKLAGIFGTTIDYLLGLSDSVGSQVLKPLGAIDEKEEQELLEYLAFLRFRKRTYPVPAPTVDPGTVVYGPPKEVNISDLNRHTGINDLNSQLISNYTINTKHP